MAKKGYPLYADDAAALVAGYPSAVFEPATYLDHSRTHGAISGETFTVPASLKYVIPVGLDGTVPTVTVGGVSRQIVKTAPSSGQVQYSDVDGTLTFHSTDSGGSAVWGITPLHTTIKAHRITRIEAEIAAAQTATDGKQPLDATLTAWAGLSTAANKLGYFTGTDTAAVTDLTAFGRTLIANANAADTRTDLELGTMATAAAANYSSIAEFLSRNPRTLYVDAAGGDDASGNGSAAYPYETLTKAFAIITASSATEWRVILGPGTFGHDLAWSGSIFSTKNVSLIGSGKAQTTVVFYIPIPPGEGEVTNAKFMELKDLTFTGEYYDYDGNSDGILYVSATCISGCKIWGKGTYNMGLGSSGLWIRFQDCEEIKDCTITAADGSPFVGRLYFENVGRMFDCVFTEEGGGQITFIASDTNNLVGEVHDSYFVGAIAIAADRVFNNFMEEGSITSRYVANNTVLECSGVDLYDSADPVMIIGNKFFSTSAPQAFTQIIGNDSPLILIEGNYIKYTGAFEEAPSMVSVFQFFDCTGQHVVRNNYIDSPTISVMVGHNAEAGLDPDYATLERDVLIEGNYFKNIFAAEDGPDDTHANILIDTLTGTSGKKVRILNNVLIHDSSAATNATWKDGCNIRFIRPADKVTVAEIHGNYMESKHPTSVTSNLRSSIRTAVNAGTDSGDYDITIGENTILPRSAQNYMFMGTAAGMADTVLRGPIHSNTAPTYQTAPTYAGKHRLGDVTAGAATLTSASASTALWIPCYLELYDSTNSVPVAQSGYLECGGAGVQYISFRVPVKPGDVIAQIRWQFKDADIGGSLWSAYLQKRVPASAGNWSDISFVEDVIAAADTYTSQVHNNADVTVADGEEWRVLITYDLNGSGSGLMYGVQAQLSTRVL
jgi:hypothetical protein